ncbi:hypothetical protein P280DRAFT_473247 [Massarina eburnea CBS 473.64]|uniref:Uncharacterized protein n=1 Tax=Massarina eburnea CBS 473.64 TaxID=1395130 RepID=A0A6A6RKK1_9PLEO|nr:hypothetical protein P280DRAFT_473247 [Massarina eburnea CBS 473.64]
MAEPSRPNIFQPAPPRMSADPATSKKSHLHLHNHSHRHHHHRHSSRHHAKEAVQSAIQLHPPTSFGDLLNKARGSGTSTPGHSNSRSRRESVQIDAQTEGAKTPREEPEVRRPVRPEDVEVERRRVKTREGELRSSLQSLSDHSLKTSRRLDDTYYALLERVSILRQTLGNLQELAGLTKELHENFDADTAELTEEIEGQFEGFEDFEEQQTQVAALEARIKTGRERADGLNARLTEAKKRVEARAKSEAELEARNTRRLRIAWGIIGAIALLVLLSILFQQFKPLHVDSPHKDLNFVSREKILDAPIPDMAKEAIYSSSRTTPSVRVETAAKAVTELGNEDRFRVFDEL